MSQDLTLLELHGHITVWQGEGWKPEVIIEKIKFYCSEGREMTEEEEEKIFATIVN